MITNIYIVVSIEYYLTFLIQSYYDGISSRTIFRKIFPCIGFNKFCLNQIKLLCLRMMSVHVKKISFNSDTNHLVFLPGMYKKNLENG